MSTSVPPPSAEGASTAAPQRISIVPRKRTPTMVERLFERGLVFLEELGVIASLSVGTLRSLFARPFELRAIVYQLETQGIASVGLAGVTALFIGMVMAIQFAWGLSRFGGMEYVGRVVGLSFARELAPTLTAVIVGGRIGAGMAAEVGSMNVTEQVDAIRALGADPVKKLVMPRVMACVIVMPILGFLALVLGFAGAMFITWTEFGINKEFFYRSALESVNLADLAAGMCKTPFFGFIIAIIGCHFGMTTRGGTEGVGRSTTTTVVAVSITILIADFMLTKLFLAMF
jgi:phospholipid/cholesterol/gamma-HCH transport system permease protein